jgi:hypothetical protein
LVVLIMLVVVDARPAEATFPGKAGKIAYEGKDGPNGDNEIYTIKAGGGGRFNVTDNSTNDDTPSWGAVSIERLLPPPVGLIPRRSGAAALNRNARERARS